MNKRTSSSIAAVVLAAASVAVSSPAVALVITQAGIDHGFALTLFVDEVPASGFCCGPLGIATNNLGQVVMQDYPNGRNYVFNDVDNQHFSAALSSAAFASFNYGIAITNVNGTLYAGNQDQSAQLFKLNPDGSSAGVVPGSVTGIAGHGVTTNPATGHVVAATGSGIYDTNVGTGASNLIVPNVNADGVAVSTNGTIIFGAVGNRILGWNYAGTLVYDSGNIGSPDGTGVIQGNNLLSGDLIANGNDGDVWLLDPLNSANNAIIANGGSRGDYVGVDNNNGSLFLTQTDSVYRLTCGPNCRFTDTTVPEPASLALLVLGLAGLGFSRRKRAR